MARDFAFLHAFSPLQALRPGTSYPATLVLTGDHDDRVAPAHSYKFAAELQRDQAARRARPDQDRVGDWARTRQAGADAVVAEFADMLAFAAEHTGLTPDRPAAS